MEYMEYIYPVLMTLGYIAAVMVYITNIRCFVWKKAIFIAGPFGAIVGGSISWIVS
ncbi:MAG: hypothetical protein WC774_01150 [Candidatus Gracilibacteria bacterium]|jgi:hypothetical protein